MENNSNSLAKISLGINLLLVIAVIVLFMKSPSGENSIADREPVDTTDLTGLGEKGEQSVVVFYNSDSLSSQSRFVMDLQNEIMQAQKDAEERMGEKENEYRRWEKRWADKQPLLQAEEQEFMQQAQQKQNEIMIFQQQLEQELYQKQTELTLSGINRIALYARELALSNNYDFVLQYSLGQNIVYCNPKMDITNELITLMNSDYNNSEEEGETVEGESEEEVAG